MELVAQRPLQNRYLEHTELYDWMGIRPLVVDPAPAYSDFPPPPPGDGGLALPCSAIDWDALPSTSSVVSVWSMSPTPLSRAKDQDIHREVGPVVRRSPDSQDAQFIKVCQIHVYTVSVVTTSKDEWQP